MKKNLLLLVSLVFITTGCRTTFDQTLLQPSRETVRPLLPKLELQEENDDNLRIAGGKVVESNSKMYTLFERELPNICESKGTKKGYIKPIITINEYSSSIGLELLQIFTLGIPHILGIPIDKLVFQLEVEFEIQDLEGNKIWKKSYYKKDKYYVGYYYNIGRRVDENMLKLYRDMISLLKKDIQKDYNQIVRDLE